MARMNREGDEQKFKKTYAKHAKERGLNPNPRDPEHHYDYKKAILKGQGPDKTGHWPSEHKKDTHPNLVINGVNTKTGKKVKSK